MTTNTPTTSIKSSISFIANLKVFQNTDLRCNKSYLLTSWGQRGNWCYVSKRLRLLYHSILTIKSLRRTLYYLPKTILIYPHTPLHDVNVTSISATQELTILIFFILDKFMFWSLLGGGGRNRCGFLPFPSTPYEITICFMNRILLFSNDD